MPDTPTDAASNAHEYSVSELAGNLKRMVEESFGHVRVRGELGRVTIAKSGHCYLDIKDDRAVINSIIWKGQMSRLSMLPEEGMEVICEGKMTTYPGRSNYQLVISKMELAGAGALMALFEKRKRMLEAEGLFAAERKRELPFMPKVIGVVTSPTGAVIRDILHRISDRFPCHVLVWPVLVQGDKAASQIAAAVTGFNHGGNPAENQSGGFPKPDVLIVARGGGSLEDLWCFNEEVVVRAVAASDIPVIGAVGHETDWTLVDYAADYRAPTPTGAAEVAVPVRADWQVTIADYGLRMTRGLRRNVKERKAHLMAARLPRAETLLAQPRQRLDLSAARLPRATTLLASARQRLDLFAARLPKPVHLYAPMIQRLSRARLRPDLYQREITRRAEGLSTLGRGAERGMLRTITEQSARLQKSAQLLEAFSYQGVLARGFALVTDSQGALVRAQAGLEPGQAVNLRFADGTKDAVIAGGTAKPAALKLAKKTTKKPKQKMADKTQPSLF